MVFDRRHRNIVWVSAVALLILILDQALKIWVKTNFYLGESVSILPFFELRFIQNNGMAFGLELGSKLLLSWFRIIVVCLLIWYIIKLLRRENVNRGYLITLTMITAGAFGNIIDCIFYGEIFSNPMPPEVATFVPWGEGYGTLFHGLVVDMLYFPLFSFTWPEWIPGWGGTTFSFFDPVFNLADSAITVGIFMLILFYTRYLPFNGPAKEAEDDTTEADK